MRHIFNCLLLQAAFLVACVPTLTFSDEIVVGRYITQQTAAQSVHLNPLKEITSFTPTSTSVGGAMRELLHGTGYAISDRVELPGFDHMPLPRVHAQFDNMQVIEILRALAGMSYEIIIIEPLRQIAFCFQSDCQQPL